MAFTDELYAKLGDGLMKQQHFIIGGEILTY